MMAASERHKSYTVEDLGRVLVPPLVLGQFYMYENVFATWAFFNEDTEHAFVEKTRKLQPKDWLCGDIFWLMDVITVDDGAKNLSAALRRIRKAHPKNTTYKWRRWYPNKPRQITTMEFSNGISPTKV